MLGRGDAAGHRLGDRAGQVSAPYGAPTALIRAVTARRARQARAPTPPASIASRPASASRSLTPTPAVAGSMPARDSTPYDSNTKGK